MRESEVPREEVFITSKVWNTEQGFEETLDAFDSTLQRLDTDYLDLYLVHWPLSEKRLDTYHALERLYKDGKVRAIGVSNFTVRHLQELYSACQVMPAVNQVEMSPFLFKRTFWSIARYAIYWSPLTPRSGAGRCSRTPCWRKWAIDIARPRRRSS